MMIGDTLPHTGQNLNGYPLSLLMLSQQTTTRLRDLNITTIEQLAFIALLNPATLREELTHLIQQDIRKRLNLPFLMCYVLPADSPHKQSKLIITAKLFSFVAWVVDENTTSPTCLYWWADPKWNGSIPFQIPDKIKRSHRRKKKKGVHTDLQRELPLFDTANTVTEQHEIISVEEDTPLFPPSETQFTTNEGYSTSNFAKKHQTAILPAQKVPQKQPLSIRHDNRNNRVVNTQPEDLREESMPDFVIVHAACSGNPWVRKRLACIGAGRMPAHPIPPPSGGRTGGGPERLPDFYSIWNNALITHFTENISPGERVFLSIDDDGITELKEQLDTSNEEPVEDFYQAVREQVIINSTKVSLNLIEGTNSEGKPKCVAFLTATVIAAYRMVDEEEYSNTNYFIRLREVLSLPTEDGGRPPGLETGIEEQLWKIWANWLVGKGFLPSAHKGKSHYDKYTRYPLSQALLRRTDRDRLCQLFSKKGWNREWDAETLGNYIRREAEYFPKHLRELLKDPSRYQAVLDDMYELYEDWQSGAYDCQGIRRTIQRNHLLAGIYRTENIRGEIEYYLYPRISRKQQVEEIQVCIAQQVITFRRERPGWYMPAYGLTEEIETGSTFDIVHPSNLETLSLPQQRFWILIPDPENAESGVYASWGRPRLGDYFIILCHQELVSQLETLRDERLIEWNGNPQPCPLTDWVEIRDCTIISPAWDGVEIPNQDLYEKLSPRENLNISLSGGLRVPGSRGWLEEYGPQITIYGFETEVEVIIRQETKDKPFFEKTQATNEPFEVEWHSAGDYVIELPDYSLERLITIRTWEELERFHPDSFEKISVNDWSLYGTLIEE
jgi:hypothetical protein